MQYIFRSRPLLQYIFRSRTLVRDQTSPGPGLNFGCNTFRDNNGRNYYNEVNNQNLPGFNLTQSNMNTAVVGDPSYQLIYCSL